MDVVAQVLADAPSRPAPGPQVALGLRRQPRRGQHEQEGEVGGRLVEDAGCVAHRHSSFRRGGHVHVVVADGDVAHDPQPRRGGEHRRVDAIGQEADDGLGFGEIQPGDAVAVLHDLVAGERVEPARGQQPGDDHPRHLRGIEQHAQRRR